MHSNQKFGTTVLFYTQQYCLRILNVFYLFLVLLHVELYTNFELYTYVFLCEGTGLFMEVHYVKVQTWIIIYIFEIS